MSGIQNVKTNQKQVILNELWTEKYRPKTVDETFIDEDIKRFLKQKIKQGDIPNLLFIGDAGTGKTTLAKAIANELNADVLELNASKDRGIDVIRNQVANFVKVKSKKPKIVFFDEADGLTQDAQQSLRNLMETYSNNARFIFTANYEHLIIEPIKDRTTVIRFKKIPKEFFYGVLEKIIQNEKIYIYPDNSEETKKQVIEKIISYSYPSLRSAVKTLQDYSYDIEGYIEELELENNPKNKNEIEKLKQLKEQGFRYIFKLPKNLLKDRKNVSSNLNLLIDKLFVMIYDKDKTPVYLIRKFIIDNQILNFAEIYKKLFDLYIQLLETYDIENLTQIEDEQIRELLNVVKNNLQISKEQLEQDILLLSEYQYRDRQSIDKEINFFGFILSVRNREFPYVIAQFVKEKYYPERNTVITTLQDSNEKEKENIKSSKNDKKDNETLTQNIISLNKTISSTSNSFNNVNNGYNNTTTFTKTTKKRKTIINIFDDDDSTPILPLKNKENSKMENNEEKKTNVINNEKPVNKTITNNTPTNHKVKKSKLSLLKQKVKQLKEKQKIEENTLNSNKNEKTNSLEVLEQRSIDTEKDLEELDKKLNMIEDLNNELF